MMGQLICKYELLWQEVSIECLIGDRYGPWASYSLLSLQKKRGMCEGVSKQSPDVKNYTASGPQPSVLKFLDPPLIVVDCEK